MSVKKQAIGVFDSGVGGLTALQKLVELLPHEDLIYLGDTARVPYGNRSPHTTQLYAKEGVQFLLERSVKLILIACNTISAVALSAIEEISPVPVIGVIRPTVEAALQCTKLGRIGIIGTQTTIRSQSYEKEIVRLRPDIDISVYAQACPLFVPLVEEGWQEHVATYAIAKEYLTPLLKANIEALILGCTHYPLLKKIIGEIMPEVQLIDSGEQAAMTASHTLRSKNLVAQEDGCLGSVECCVTDITPTVLRLAKEFLGLSPDAIHKVSI